MEQDERRPLALRRRSRCRGRSRSRGPWGRPCCIGASISTGPAGRPGRPVGDTRPVVPTVEPHPDLPPGRPFEGMADLRAMEACLARVVEPAPAVRQHDAPATSSGGSAIATPGTDWRRLVRVWTAGDEVVAYGWLSPPASLDWHQRADLPAGVRAGDRGRDAGLGVVRRLASWRVIDGAGCPARPRDLGDGRRRRAARPARRRAAGRRPPSRRTTHWYRRLDDGATDRRARPARRAIACVTCASPTTSRRASRCTGRPSRRRA